MWSWPVIGRVAAVISTRQTTDLADAHKPLSTDGGRLTRLSRWPCG
jgi:hypothetical protein